MTASQQGELAAKLQAAFLEDLDEQLGTLDTQLLAFESDPNNAERLTAVFRVAHTLKSAARATGVPYIGDACHTLESRLSSARDGTRPLTPHDFRVLFFAKDALADAAQRLRRSQSLSDTPIAHLNAILVGDEALPDMTAMSGGLANSEGGGAATFVDSGTDSHIRITADKADALMAAGSQLLVSRSRLSLRANDAEALQSFVTRWASEWRRTGPEVRRILTTQQAAHHALQQTVNANAPSTSAKRDDLTTLFPLLDAFDSYLERMVHDSTQLTQHTARDADAFRDMIGDLFDRVRGVRMRPFADACTTLPRAVHDASASVGKPVSLVITGRDVEADRGVLEALRDALIHLVRNAVDHGIETANVRAARGKPGEGRVEICAALRGERLVVTVTDDGGGVDPVAIRHALQAQGLPVPTDDADVFRTLFLGGFSTRAEATDISGRGVGLNAVEAAVTAIGGSVAVTSELGRGTTFTLECPVTLATIRALLATVGGQTVAIPTSSIVHLQRARAEEIVRAEGRDVYLTDSTPVPVASLARLLGPPLADKPHTGAVALVVVESPDGRLALAVEQLREEEEIVVRPIERVGNAIPLLSGAAILGTGDIALVLNPVAAIPAGLGTASGPTLAPRTAESAARKRVLIVDDSITTRTLEQSTVEAAGYEVITAVDGADAWRRLQDESFALVVSDIEMPRMDGLTLCETMRASKRTANIPVILVTALESPAQRKRGLDVGADAYIGKSTFDQQNLVETIRQLIG